MFGHVSPVIVFHMKTILIKSDHESRQEGYSFVHIAGSPQWTVRSLKTPELITGIDRLQPMRRRHFWVISFCVKLATPPCYGDWAWL